MSSSESPRKVLMIGPALSQRSGIASVEAAYTESWNSAQYDLCLVASYTSHYNSKIKKLGIALRALLTAAWRLLAWRPDIVHVHFSWRGSFYRKSAFILLTRLFTHPKLMLHCHAADFESFYFNAGKPLQAFIRWTLARSHRLLVLSHSQRRLFESLLRGHSIEILTNPVQCPPLATRSRQRMVLVLGELGTRKGTYDVLRSIPGILARCPDLEFCLAGDGDVEQVKAIVATKPWRDQVRIPGWVNDAEKRQLLEKALIFLLPSYHEGVPVALLEAMASGVPVVSTPVGGIPDLVSHEKNGLLVEPGDVNAIASAVTRLAEDDILRAALARSARQDVLGHCEAGSVVTRLFALYDSLLSLEKNKSSQEVMLAQE